MGVAKVYTQKSLDVDSLIVSVSYARKTEVSWGSYPVGWKVLFFGEIFTPFRSSFLKVSTHTLCRTQLRQSYIDNEWRFFNVKEYVDMTAK